MQTFSKEWFEALTDNLQNDATFQQKAKGFDSHLHFRVLKDQKTSLSENVEFGMWVPEGRPNWYGDIPEEVDIILEGKASTYNEVFQGKRNVVLALTMGAIKLKKGSLTKLTGNLGAVNRFIEVAGAVS